MNLQEAEKLAKELIKKHLGDSRHNWRFKWSHAKQTFGSCNINGSIWNGVNYIIKLSKPLTELNDVDRVTNTILHEIAHALQWDISGYMSHDAEWIRLAKSIGCDGERCYDGEVVNTPKSKYSLVCGTCGKTTPKHRKPKRMAACGKCCKAHNGGKFSHDYVLELKEN
jgi:predicted SprT family Zn-dependent metalloprotease